MILPHIDVIMPAYNAEATISSAVSSVLSQTATDFSVFVVDDGSTDSTAEIVSDLARQDRRVHLERTKNGGIVPALNLALSLGRAEFVARLDADDISAPNRHERQLRYLMANPDVVAVSGAHLEIDEYGAPTGREHHPPATAGSNPEWAPAQEPQLTQPFMVARRAALDAVGGYRTLQVSEDSDLYWRLAELGRLENIDHILGSYRMHKGSISGASVENGRMMALCSQLAALSAVRRADGRADVKFDPGQAPHWRASGSLLGMVDAASTDLGLDAGERAWLRTAAAGKIMELAGYRPYEITAEDCRFIAAALDTHVPLPEGNRRDLAKMRAATGARLLRLGRTGDALSLAGPALWPELVARAATGRLYWTKHLG